MYPTLHSNSTARPRMHQLLAHVGVPLGHLHMWALSCVLQGAAIGLASAAMLYALRGGTAVPARKTITLVHKHYLYRASAELKAQLVRALCESTRTVHADSDSLLSHLEELSSVKEKDPLALLRNVE